MPYATSFSRLPRTCLAGYFSDEDANDEWAVISNPTVARIWKELKWSNHIPFSWPASRMTAFAPHVQTNPEVFADVYLFVGNSNLDLLLDSTRRTATGKPCAEALRFRCRDRYGT